MPRFLGPTAPWLDEAEEETLFPQVRKRVVETLRSRLRERILALEASSDIDPIVLEIRIQMCDAAVVGHLTRATDLHDLMVELLEAREHARKL